MLLNSIRGRFLLWLAVLLVAVLSGFGITAYQLHRTNQMNQVDHELERRLGALDFLISGVRPPYGERRGRPPPDFGPGWRPPPPPGDWEFKRNTNALMIRLGMREIRIPHNLQALFDESDPSGHYFAVWSRSGNRFSYPTNAPWPSTQPERTDGDTRPQNRTRADRREAFRYNEANECILVGRSISMDLAAIRRFGWLLGLGGGTVLALGLGGSWWLVGNALRPMHHISLTAKRISAGNLSDRIEVADTDNELGRLADVLNDTFTRLEAAFAQQKQFTADAAHELRTPIAVLISETQTVLARERPAGDYRETIEQCLLVAQQMRRLTESLLDLSRFDSKQETLRNDSVDLAQVAAESIALLRPLARQRDVKISCALAPAEAHGDAQRLSQVVTNLLTNAIGYNHPGGEVRVCTASENGHAVLKVSDTGMGIAKEDLPHIFDRFYRADKVRSRVEGHTGLGLAIVKAIIELHRGTIHVSSDAGAGSTFLVRLPVEVKHQSNGSEPPRP